MKSPKSRKNGALNRARAGGFTLVEVAVAAALVVFALSGVYALHGQAMGIMRTAKDSSAASQILQQRLEQLRMNAYGNVTTSATLRTLMHGAGGETDSESEMRGVTNFQETVTISTFPRPGVTPAPVIQSFSVSRASGKATASNTADLSSQEQVKVNLVVTWNSRKRSHRREFATILANGGVSTVGIGTRPELPLAPSTAPPITEEPPEEPPASNKCKHGRPWPHCGSK